MWQRIAELAYHQHGGSGLGLALCDIMELELDRMTWLCEWLEETREAEAERLANAGRRK